MIQLKRAYEPATSDDGTRFLVERLWPRSPFMGPAAMGQAVLFTLHPTAALNKDERLEAVMGLGGVTDCGNAQNCERVCPKGIPLTRAIGELGRQTTIKFIKDLLWQ